MWSYHASITRQEIIKCGVVCKTDLQTIHLQAEIKVHSAGHLLSGGVCGNKVLEPYLVGCTNESANAVCDFHPLSITLCANSVWEIGNSLYLLKPFCWPYYVEAPGGTVSGS